MNISNLSSTLASYGATGSSGYRDRNGDLKSLEKALNSGNLTTAQNALATFKQIAQNAPGAASSTQPFATNSQLGKDFTSLQNALNSGDLTGAQSAFATLKTDLAAVMAGGTDSATGTTASSATAGTKSASAAHHHHHHHAGTTGGSATSSLLNSVSGTTSSSSVGGTLDTSA